MLLQFFIDPGITSGVTLDSFIWQLFKWLFVISSILYIFFAAIVVRQISLMKQTLETSFSPTVTLIGYIHLAVAVLVALIYVVVL